MASQIIVNLTVDDPTGRIVIQEMTNLQSYTMPEEVVLSTVKVLIVRYLQKIEFQLR